MTYSARGFAVEKFILAEEADVSGRLSRLLELADHSFRFRGHLTGSKKLFMFVGCVCF